MTSLDFDLEYF